MRSTVWIVCILAFALAACQPATPEATEAPPPMEAPSPSPVVQVTTPPAGEPEAYPAPTVSNPNGYPAPGQQGTPSTWEDAVALVMEGKVAQVLQTHSLTVTLTLKDGQVISTIEPEIDEIFRIIEQCGDLCKDIIRATE